jgi:hypothetical protein
MAGTGGGGLLARLLPPAVALVLLVTLELLVVRWIEAMRLSRPQPAGASVGVGGCIVVICVHELID